MIVSSRKQANEEAFVTLLENAQGFLVEDANKRPDYYLSRKGVKFETDVFEALKLVSTGTQFQDTINLVSGRSFPDIVANEYFGVEVKTSSEGQPWKCLGNSVLESSRIETVERIYMFFGKIIAPPEFRFKKYQDCLREVAVTHSPRYMVDFEISEGDTIFDKIKMPYEELRQLDNPIKPFLSYYRELYGQDCDLWWLDTGNEEQSSHIIIKFWKSVKPEEKIELRRQMLALFPEIMRKGGAGDNKYNRAAAWLIKTHNIVHPSFRDIFTGGCLSSVVIGQKTFTKVPTFFTKSLHGELKIILSILQKISADVIEYYWGESYSKTERRSIWLDKMSELGPKWLKESTLDIDTFIKDELR